MHKLVDATDIIQMRNALEGHVQFRFYSMKRQREKEWNIERKVEQKRRRQTVFQIFTSQEVAVGLTYQTF